MLCSEKKMKNKRILFDVSVMAMALLIAGALSSACWAGLEEPPQPPISPHILAPGSNEIPSFGTWDAVNRVFTVNTDVSKGGIKIDEGNLTLDGAGYMLIGNDLGSGIYLIEQNDVTIRDVNVYDFQCGIYIRGGQNNTLTGNTVWNQPRGIYILGGKNNSVINNTVFKIESGIVLNQSRNGTVVNNTVSYFNDYGIYALSSSGNIMNGNIINGNNQTDNCGIYFDGSCGYNFFTGNTISDAGTGVWVFKGSSNNEIYNNNFINNLTQASVISSDNVFNLDAPIGGNYWSDWTSPDTDADGFVDNPYVVAEPNVQDNLPWVIQDGWLDIGATPPGSDIVVQPVDPTTGQTPVTLTFDEVIDPGVTSVTSTTPGGNQGPPQGFRFGSPPVIYEITTTATFTGQIEVCFDYNNVSFGNENNLKLFHSPDGTNWVDITTSLDTENDIICGTVTSLSFFGVFELEFVDPVELLGELAGKVFGLNLQHGIENSLDAKLDAALKALEDVNNNNDVAAINALEAFINAVEAQSGNKIATEDADVLIAAAEEIIAVLSGM